jgi:hypothetical protein
LGKPNVKSILRINCCQKWKTSGKISLSHLI